MDFCKMLLKKLALQKLTKERREVGGEELGWGRIRKGCCSWTLLYPKMQQFQVKK